MNMVIIGPLLLTFLSGFSTLLGIITLYIRFKRVEKSTIFFLSISFSMMILISLIELLPSSILNILKIYGIKLGIIINILLFFLGYNFTIFIDKYIKEDKNNLYKIGIKNTIVLVLHNILEGIIVFNSSILDIRVGMKVFLAIMIHNISEGISICIPISGGGGGKKKAIYYTLLASISEPLGALLSYILIKDHINETIISMIQIFVSGLMISISINDILKELLKYKEYKYIIYGIIISIIIFLVML